MHWGQKSSSSPRIGGVQWMSTVESTLCSTGDHGARRGSCPGRYPDLAEIAPASLWLQWASWRLLWRVPSSRRDVAERRGFCKRGSCSGQGPDRVRGSRPCRPRIPQWRKYAE